MATCNLKKMNKLAHITFPFPLVFYTVQIFVIIDFVMTFNMYIHLFLFCGSSGKNDESNRLENSTWTDLNVSFVPFLLVFSFLINLFNFYIPALYLFLFLMLMF